MKKFAIIILVMLSYLAACEKQTQKPKAAMPVKNEY